MRWLLMVFCLVASSSWASVIPLIPPPNIAGTPAGYITTGPVAITDAATAVEMRAAVGWQTVRMGATMTLGEGAAAVALAALRATPALATASALIWLSQIGLQKCLDGTWCKRPVAPIADGAPKSAAGHRWVSGACVKDTPVAAIVCNAAPQGVTTADGCRWDDGSESGSPGMVCTARFSNGAAYGAVQAFVAGDCVAGFVVSGSLCVADPSVPGSPASDADWNQGLTYPLPPQVASDLAAQKVGVPVKISPNVDPATGKPSPINLNLSDPYVDPVTGKRYRDIAVLTPNADGKTATLTTARQEVDANGNPVTDPATGGGKAPEPQTDPCSGHDTRMGCMEQGDVPEGPDLKEQKINVAITPDAGWGPDTGSCPVDIPLTYMGHSFGMSWSGICSFASMIRPIVLAMAWFGAALIVVGASKQGGD
ncbi:hypothetical protein LMG19087_02142 [Ralstonia wenshanensis]|uniref:virulence factor TspB C-terminal domain-related protein n=1 Tax=Ralstonia wenshanensis TaxID=2842456 RepID=UPI0028F4DB41|nr:virulence factor TspB C-terminal domain-related protein [Ralstonia wenshanensis]CAJ0814557.1 hypothetical protein LMG19087_02142 [Ralstonia wenshanensis]